MPANQYKNKTKQQYMAEWRLKNKEVISKHNKTAIVSGCAREYSRKYRTRLKQNNPEKFKQLRKKQNQANKKYSEKNLLSWLQVIPASTICQCCGKGIYFQAKSIHSSIHFDHRYGKGNQIKNVKAWLARHICDAANIILWKSFDFGMLCRRCNICLPTEDRSEFLDNALRYHLGA